MLAVAMVFPLCFFALVCRGGFTVTVKVVQYNTVLTVKQTIILSEM